MPRHLARAGAFVAALLIPVAVLAPTALAAGKGGGAQGEIEFKMRVNGFDVTVAGGENEGKQNVELTIVRRDQIAKYVVPAQITDSTVKARFGTLGELEYSFVPKEPAAGECFGANGAQATFTGTFTFTGENEFIHIDADRATGTYTVDRPPSACSAPRSERASAAPRVTPFESYAGSGATLFAVAGSPRAQVRELNVADEGKGKKGAISAFLVESGEGMTVLRGAVRVLDARAFKWDFAAGTATVSPLAPFTGTARFTRRAGGHPLWTGSLRVAILGETKPVRMDGGAFRVVLHRGLPHND
jgi:hypothetical protein